MTAIWVAGVVAIGRADGFESGGIGLVLAVAAAPLMVSIVAFLTSSWFRRTVLGFDPRMVLAAQLWRVVGAAFLFGWAAGELPADFAIPAGVGDIATGIAAGAALAALLHGTLSRRKLWLFTALGIGDFATAILTGAILNQPEQLDALPWLLFPTLAVPFFAGLHALALIQLTKSRLRMLGRPEPWAADHAHTGPERSATGNQLAGTTPIGAGVSND